MVAYAANVSEQDTASRDVAYTEKVGIPVWFWPTAVAVAIFVPIEIFLGAYPLVSWPLAGVLTVVVLIWLARIDRLRIRVDQPSADAELRVDDAHIPVSYISSVSILDPVAKREVLGPLGELHMFVIQRPWIREAVRVEIDDPQDPTPCWVISSRRPAALAEAILAAKSPASPSADLNRAG